MLLLPLLLFCELSGESGESMEEESRAERVGVRGFYFILFLSFFLY